MVMRNKTNAERYLASSADVGDWEDENLDYTDGISTYFIFDYQEQDI